MNGDVRRNELPQLEDDDDVKLLCRICQEANVLDEAQAYPIKALFAKYDTLFAKNNRNSDRDDLLFRYIMRIGEAANRTRIAGEEVDLYGSLRELLSAHGVTLIDGDEDGLDEVTRSIEVPQGINGHRERQRPGRRRVSFDDAGLEETWLSEHSRSLTAPVTSLPQEQGLLSRAPKRGRVRGSARRARSTSSQRSVLLQQPAPKQFQHTSPSSTYASEPGGPINPTLLFQPSQTQLEQNAEAFRYTSDLRYARRCLHRWHDEAVLDEQQHVQAYAIAAAHDRRMLQKSALEFLLCALREKQDERRIEAYFARWEENVMRSYNQKIMYKAFTHWAVYSGDQKIQTAVAHRHILRIRYFNRWRVIAVENAMKARSILGRKYLMLWRDRTARKLLVREQAAAHYEEALHRRVYESWCWQLRERRVAGWRDERVKRKALEQWIMHLNQLQYEDQRARQQKNHRKLRRCILTLASRTRDLKLASSTATAHHDRRIQQRNFTALSIQAKLVPIATTLSVKLHLDLQRKALAVWHNHYSLLRQAVEVDRKRILHNTCRDWNDAVRYRALGQRIDERVLVEHLYKWVLEERLRLLRRTMEGRVVQHLIYTWHEKSLQQLSVLERAEQAFAQGKRRRKLATAMVRLNTALRQREDAERAALEFANSRTLPNILYTWSQQTAHVRQLAKWAIDARFYSLTCSTLRVWSERTTEHKHNRRREAYVQVRGRMKVRVVGKCFVQWRTKCVEVHSMDGEAERSAQSRLFNIGTQTFDKWRAKAFQLRELHSQAIDHNTRKLLSSALSAAILRYQEIATLTQQAVSFQHETDLALLATSLKRMQWATFTTTRQGESAEALWVRNRDQHMRQMLRHWYSQLVTRRTAKVPAEEQEEPESPSLRPASRAAARSASRERGSQPASPAATPAYMRTPSRSRRAGRFRPLVLPTPAGVTPMAFDAAYLATTPAPLSGAVPGSWPFQAPEGVEGLAMQVTPFARKLRAGGIERAGAGGDGVVGGTAGGMPRSALRGSVVGRSVRSGMEKSVRFGGSSRVSAVGVGEEDGGHVKSS